MKPLENGRGRPDRQQSDGSGPVALPGDSRIPLESVTFKASSEQRAWDRVPSGENQSAETVYPFQSQRSTMAANQLGSIWPDNRLNQAARAILLAWPANPGASRRLSAVACMAAALLIANDARAQTNEELFQHVTWDLLPAGARAAGMGRAFVAVSDDGAATASNPAGLVRLRRTQANISARSGLVRVSRFAQPDSLLTLRSTVFSTEVQSLSLVSFSWRWKERAAIGLSRRELMNYQEAFALSRRTLPSRSGGLLPVQGEATIKGATYAASVAYDTGHRVAFGITAGVSALSVSAQSVRYLDDLNEDILLHRTHVNGNKHAPFVSAGLLISPSTNVSIGFVFSTPAWYRLKHIYDYNPGYPGSNQAISSVSNTVTFVQPPEYSAGVSFRPARRLLVASDVVFTHSSFMSDETLMVLRPARPSDFSERNAVAVHIGGEYRVPLVPVVARLGLRHGGGREIVYSPTATSSNDRVVMDAIFTPVPPRRAWTGSLGVGLPFGSRYQFDIAYGSSNLHTSLLLRF